MAQTIKRDVNAPKRVALSWEELWLGPDGGLIQCWERGREKRVEDPELAARAIAGELIILAWKGGVEEKLKTGKKYGTLYYLATWQGLRGESLDIDLDGETRLVCSRTGQSVTFVPYLPNEELVE
jgi:hypothetical protein